MNLSLRGSVWWHPSQREQRVFHESALAESRHSWNWRHSLPSGIISKASSMFFCPFSFKSERSSISVCPLLKLRLTFSILNLRYRVQRVHEPTEIVYKSLSVCSLSERGHNFHYTQKGVNNLPKLKYNEIINKFKFLSSGQVPYYKTCGVDLGKRSEALTDNSFLIILKEICYGA